MIHESGFPCFSVKLKSLLCTRVTSLFICIMFYLVLRSHSHHIRFNYHLWYPRHSIPFSHVGVVRHDVRTNVVLTFEI